jgi:hypothetical protein
MRGKAPSKYRIILQHENFAPGRRLGVEGHGPSNASSAHEGINTIRERQAGGLESVIGCLRQINGRNDRCTWAHATNQRGSGKVGKGG